MLFYTPKYPIWPLVLLAGCGTSKPSDQQPVFPAGGIVTYRGAPVEGASVVFTSQGQGRGAAGMTGPDGRFKLRTYEPNDGASAGEYVVVVQKTAGDGDWGKKIGEMNFKSTKEYEDWKLTQSAPRDTNASGKRPPIPLRYGDAQTSPLKAAVATSGPNEFTFELQD